MHQVGKQDFYCIRMHGQQIIKILITCTVYSASLHNLARANTPAMSPLSQSIYEMQDRTLSVQIGVTECNKKQLDEKCRTDDYLGEETVGMR